MKKIKLVLFGVILLSSAINASTTHIHSTGTYHQDDKEGLRHFLRQPSADKGKLNLEKTGLSISDTLEWDNSEAWVTKIPGLTWSNETSDKRITTITFQYIKLAGILDCSLFTDLNKLKCNNNQLTGINIANCINLTDLDCYGNRLTKLNLTNCTGLKKLACYNNQLTDLNLTNCTGLSVLHCQENQLTELKVNDCASLTILACYNNRLNILDCSNCASLSTLHCQNNKLYILKVANGKRFWDLKCNANYLKFSSLPNPQNMNQYLYTNQYYNTAPSTSVFQSIDLGSEYNIYGTITTYNWFAEENTELTATSLTDRGNGRFVTDESHANKTLVCKMTNAFFPGLELTYKIHVEAGTGMFYPENEKEGLRRFLRQASAEPGKLNLEQLGLNISDTLIWYTSEEWVEKVQGVTWYDDNEFILRINFENKKLAGSFDCSLFINLMELVCNDNQLSSIKFVNSSLTDLICYNNQLTNLDIKSCIHLMNLFCNNNQLTNLNIGGNWLINLICNDNQLTNLDLTGHNKLINLNCYNNQLTNLNLTNCSGLEYLECYNNQLTNLVVTGCSNLRVLICNDNKLEILDVTDCAKSMSLYCQNNKLAEIYYSNAPQSFTHLNCSYNYLSFHELPHPLDVEKEYNYLYQFHDQKLHSTYSVFDIICITSAYNTLKVSWFIEKDGILEHIILDMPNRHCYLIDESLANKPLVYKLTDNFFPGLELTRYITVNDYIGLRDMETSNEHIDKLTIYPTIVGKGEIIHINAMATTMEVYNLNGQKVASYKEINAINAPSVAGNYIIRINIEGKIETHKIVVK